MYTKNVYMYLISIRVNVMKVNRKQLNEKHLLSKNSNSTKF